MCVIKHFNTIFTFILNVKLYNIINYFSENTDSNHTQSQKSSCTTEDTMSTQDSKLESVFEGSYQIKYNIILFVIQLLINYELK